MRILIPRRSPAPITKPTLKRFTRVLAERTTHDTTQTSPAVTDGAQTIVEDSMRTFKQHQLTEAFTKQHYIAIAKILADARGNRESADAAIDLVAERLADLFKKDNPLFDAGRFITACE